MIEKLSGPALILLAALLWGTDALFRFPTAEKLDPTFIVFIEHLVGLAVLAPWILKKHSTEVFKLGWKEWICALIIGAGGGAIATVLFTASFRYLNPSITILLQKLQPIFTVLIAGLFLGERPEPKFYPWAAIALVAGFVLSFPDLDLSFLRESGNVHAKGVIYALSAAGIWGISTVAGRKLVLNATPAVTTFWRYAFGFGMLSSLLYLAGVPLSWDELGSRSILIALAYLGFVTGLLPLLAYYRGLARTPASVATFIELAYPVSAIVLNAVFLHAPLSPVQMGAGGALLFAVTMISL